MLLLSGLVLASCASAGSENGGSASGRCVYRYATDNSKGGQMRWGPCNNHDPFMKPIFEEKKAPDAG